MKVMFSQMCVCHSVHGGGVWWGQAWKGVCMVKGVYVAEGDLHGREACVVGVVHGGGVHHVGCAWQGVCVAGETSTEARSTHPTGMHSC